jgi:hypothetical protein
MDLHPFRAGDRQEGEPATRPQDTECLGEDGGLVGGQVDHPVGDDQVDAGVGQRDSFDVPVQESGVLKAGGGAEPFGLGELGVGHGDAGHLAGGANQCGRGEGVGA